ncbi:hypothetical protein [Paenibacillus sp. yr247]|uniref:hypothetical protein n=1 Tax=Paenibacillus sp. yr247 TaxID=1761880 RepID=UPI000B81EDEA
MRLPERPNTDEFAIVANEIRKMDESKVAAKNSREQLDVILNSFEQMILVVNSETTKTKPRGFAGSET